MPFRGISRIRRVPPAENGVWMFDGIAGFEISESTYRERGYSPALELLSWKTHGKEEPNTTQNRVSRVSCGA